MRKKSISFVFILLLVWGVITYFLFLDRPIGREHEMLINDIGLLENALKMQVAETQRLLRDLEEKKFHDKLLSDEHNEGAIFKTSTADQADQKVKVTSEPLENKKSFTVENPSEKLRKIGSSKTLPDGSPVIAVLVFSCNRITVQRCIGQLIKYRPNPEQFPIVVSQDCEHQQTTDVIKSYGDQVFHIQQPDQSEINVSPKEKNFKGYFKIARHYEWALNQIFMNFTFDTAIVVEDDLDVSRDFFEYFLGTYPLLVKDSSLWCVSAWNDNGKSTLVDNNAPDLLYRTDFFPGLGWMLTSSLWKELAPKWPKAYWDDWIRQPAQRKERSCIRPELSRTKTFGKIGVSNGMFFEKHLKFIKLNDKFVPFTKRNLTYLLKENYDVEFTKLVNESIAVDPSDLKNGKVLKPGPVKILYGTREFYKRTAKEMGLMDDFKSGVPRTSYRGVVAFFHNKRRVYLSPNRSWTGYDLSWS